MSPAPRSRPYVARRRGLTAVESLLSVAIVSITGAALLTTLGSAVRSSREVALTTVARGLADQLLDEAAALPVPAGTPPATPAGPRSGYLVIDHFNGWTESPPQDRYGRALGTEGLLSGTPVDRPVGLQADAALLARFGRTVTVEKVTPSAGAWAVTGLATPFRRVTVRVSFTENGKARTLVEASRIVCHVGAAL